MVPEEIAMRSKSIVTLGCEHESLRLGCSPMLTACDRAPGRSHERGYALLFGGRLASQCESYSRFECLRNLTRIPSLREAAYAFA
jgi:hypothetical protein